MENVFFVLYSSRISTCVNACVTRMCTSMYSCHYAQGLTGEEGIRPNIRALMTTKSWSRRVDYRSYAKSLQSYLNGLILSPSGFPSGHKSVGSRIRVSVGRAHFLLFRVIIHVIRFLLPKSSDSSTPLTSEYTLPFFSITHAM